MRSQISFRFQDKFEDINFNDDGEAFDDLIEDFDNEVYFMSNIIIEDKFITDKPLEFASDGNMQF